MAFPQAWCRALKNGLPSAEELEGRRARMFLIARIEETPNITGDVRSNSVKRVASAVGEGSVCIHLVHEVLGE